MPNLVPKPRALTSLRDSVNEIFDRWMPARREEERQMMPETFLTGPAVDVVEDDKMVRVTAEMPGLNDKDFNVEIEGDRLILSGEKKHDREEKKENYYYSECSYGSFSRVIPLPCEVDADKANATYKNGMLEVELPKKEGAKSKRVNVNIT
ncbi:MAG: Hsp20/alpha crystallin family protein [Clostridiaceae bacterium]